MEKLIDYFHDLNNKLSCILGTTILLKRTHCQDCKATVFMDSISETGLEMGDIIVKCRSSLQERVDIELSSLNMYDSFQPESPFFAELLRIGKEMLLEIEIVNRLSLGCSILVSPTFIESGKQSMNNVFFNAKKANATRIRIIAVEHNDYVSIHVQDNGDGMDAETIACLGLSIASKTSTGQGTRITKKLVIKEGAVIDWSSPGIGAGTCVTIRMTKYKSVI